ncbi:MAG: ABC transporter substrate-binding protein [Candidatus Rokubacteria bacterium]|nr:ABC transporter substrate-binding protein [Candidatus Rokubacteria bacterium]
MERRAFLLKAGVMTAGAAAVLDAPNVIAQPKFQWRMPTSWPPAADILIDGARQFARIVDEMSQGRLKIQVFAGGELIPPFGVFDACSQGTVEMYNSASYYWAGKEAATQWFTAMPFGLNPLGTYAWYYEGGGLKLWEETYAPFNMVPRPSGSTGPQAGGWFRKKISSIADYKGLKMRIPGLGGKVIARAGSTVVLLPAGEIYTAIERGTIDATEWVGPHDDMKFGLHNTAKYYYFPGWHEPGTTGEFTFNKKAYESLPADLRRILDYAAASMHTFEYMAYFRKNSEAMRKLRTDFKNKVEILTFPKEVMTELRKLSVDVLKEESEKSPIAKKVHASYTKFQQLVSDFAQVSEGSYYEWI